MRTTRPFQRLIVLLLCLALLAPAFVMPAYATEDAAAAEDPPIEITEVIREAENTVVTYQAANTVSLPTYSTYGKVSNTLLYDCGNGIANNGADSAITIVTGTNATEFANYQTKLTNNGYQGKTWSQNSNRFGSYVSRNGSHKVYTYYLGAYGETRIIVDTNPDTVNGYSYTPQTGKTVEPKLVMWGLSTSYTGYHIDTSVAGGNSGRENNGVLLIIRMSDNSLFFYDGGILAQMNDAESAELLAFCRELTGTTPGQKMVINTWFVSHAHDDHFQAFGRFININHKHFDLKNVVYNIDLERPDVVGIGGKGTTPASKNLREALNLITTHYPNVKYYKPHTGETFKVAGIEFDVLYTHEDRLLPASDGSLSFHQDTLSDSKIDIIDKNGTYRTELYKNTTTKQSDFNDTSTVLRVRFENGVDGIFYADMNLAESIVKKIHPQSALKTDMMMIPHHLFDSHTDLAKYADARVYLSPQSKAAVYGDDNNYTTNDNGDRDSLRNNFVALKDALTAMGRTEGVHYDIFWGGTETVTIDINALGAELGYSNAAATGSYYTTERANSFAYNGEWTISSPAAGRYQSVVNATEDELEASEAVDVSMNQIVFVPVTGTLKQGGKYILMNDYYGHILSFDATAEPDVYPGSAQHGTRNGQSITLDSDGGSANTYYMDGQNVIMDHSDRHFAIWNLYQYPCANKNHGLAAIPDGGTLDILKWSNFGPTVQTNGTIYEGTELQKLTDVQDPYWQALSYGANTANQDFQLRYLCTRSNNTAFKNYYQNSQQKTSDGDKNKYIIELLEDGTYVVYFKMSDTDFRFLSCSADGVWSVVQYTGNNAKANAKADYNKLKIRLYEYQETDESKTVAFSGNQKYYVNQGAALDGILSDISACITVYDASRKNQQIPYNYSEITRTNFGGTEVEITAQKEGYYWLDGSEVNTAVPGQYPVAIKYRNDSGKDTTIGEVFVIVGEGFITMEGNEGFVMKNSGQATKVEKNVAGGVEHATFLFNGEPKVITVGMLTDSNGKPVNTAQTGKHTGLTLTYQGIVICEDYILEVLTSNEALDYPVYPQPGSVTVDKGTTTTEDAFSGTGVANIELSATAIPLDKGVDVIVIVDLSSSMRYHVNNSDYACGPKYFPNGNLNNKTTSDYGTQKEQLTYVYKEEWWQYTRMAAMENALINMVNTLSSSNTDVQIAIADFGDLDHYEFKDAVLDRTIGAVPGSKPYFDANLDDTGTLEQEFSNHVNFILGRDDTIQENAGTPRLSQPYWLDQTKHNEDFTNKHGWTYTGKQLPKIFTGNGTLTNGAFMDVKDLQTKLGTLTDDLKKQNGKRLGTNYDIGLETAYRLAYAREQANIANGEDREIVCIFMSDGAAMQYNYLSGRSQTEAWSQCIIGETDEILTNNADKYVITSDPYDTSVKQDPYLQAMLKDLLGILKDGNLIIPGTTNTYPKYTGDETDFFKAMKGIGVDCDWELLFQIAYKLYTHHSTRTVALADGTIIQRDGQNATGAKLLEAVVMHMRKPSYDKDGNQYQYQTLSPYYYFYNAEGKNWWAEALKGDSDKLYPVPSKFAYEDSTEWGELASKEFYYGDVRNNFSGETTKIYDMDGKQTATLALDGKDYIGGYRGLNVDLYTIGFSLGTENRIDYTEAAKVLENLATGPAYNFAAADGDELTAALSAITYTISSSAKRAYYTDTMGPNFDLSTEKTVVDKNGNIITVNGKPTVRVLEYQTTPIYDENDEIIDYERKKDANGNEMYTVREVITFEDLDGDGDTDAWSDQVYNIVNNEAGDQVKEYPNIWDESNNLITGKYVRYNANKYVSESNTGAISLKLDDSGLTFSLEAETFFWIIGTLGETEMVLEYQVYLEGSLQGKLPDAKKYYDTNEKAPLYYVNYLGNNCRLDTVTPKFPWGEGIELDVLYYLVDENGNPLSAPGVTTDFSGSQKLGEEQDVVVGPGTTDVDANTLLPQAGLDPDIYELYDPSGKFTFTYDETNSGGTKWDITVGSDKKDSTYVTNYGEGKEPTTATTSDGLTDVNFEDMTIYFAVKLKQRANPETVVIDFGLPVNINVLANDGLSDGSTVIGVNNGSTVPAPGALASGFDSTTATDAFGAISIVDNKVQYSINTMSMKDADVFTYAAQDEATKYYYYSTVTVIPATIIYYEDSFVDFKVYQFNKNDKDGKATLIDENNSIFNDVKWKPSAANGNGIQQEDRPGFENGIEIDADNIYGHDSAYTSMSTYSLGSAMMFTAKEDANGLRTYGTAEFDFYGTGFDIISLTSKTTGTITVQVFSLDESGNIINADKVQYDPNNANMKLNDFAVKTGIVDTYYGYKFANGAWSPDTTISGDNSLYQVPVMKMSGLTYGKYRAIITISYSDFFDHALEAEYPLSYDFYLDAIRIYDPADDGANNEVIEDAYIADHEGWPEYFELRNLLIKKNTFDSLGQNDAIDGIVFIDGFAELSNSTGNNTGIPGTGNVAGKTAQITDYANFGPNNELYLAPGQAIAFDLKLTDAQLDKIHLAMKSVGGTANVEYYNLLSDGTTQEDQKAFAVATATDLYYDITALNGDTVVIKNTSGAILSITNVKVTYKSAHTDSLDKGFCTASRTMAAKVLNKLNNITEGEELPEKEAQIKLEALSLSLESEVLVNVYFTLNNITADVNHMGLLIWDTMPAEATMDHAQTVISGVKAGDGRYMVQTDGIAAKNLGDDIYLCVYAKTENGIVYSDVITYSPKQYALSRLEKSSNEAMKALCVAMLNYGAEAQKYFGYKTDDLMNASLTAQQQALVSAYSADLFTGAVQAEDSKIGAFAKTGSFAVRSASVSFEGAFTINYYFAPDAEMNGDMTFCYWTAEAYKNADVLTVDNATGTTAMELTNNGCYWANITGIAAKELDDTFYVAAVYTDAQGNTHCTGVIAYSLSTYCMKNANGNMGTLAQATAIYGYHAKVYFGTEN